MKANYKRKKNKGLFEHKEQYGENSLKKDTIIWIACVAAFGITVIIDLFLTARHNDAYLLFNLIERIIVLVAFLYFAYFSETKPQMAGRMIITAFAVLPLIALLLNGKVIQLLTLFFFFADAVYTASAYLKYRTKSTGLNGVFIIGALSLIIGIGDYSFKETFSMKLVYIAIPLTAGIIIATITLLVKGKIPDEIAEEDYEKAALVVFASVAAFVLCYASLVHLNYIFDFRPPEEVSIVVEDKDMERGARTPTRFLFYSTVDGQKYEFTVDSYDYFEYEIGDSYTVNKGKGAFGEAYYYTAGL